LRVKICGITTEADAEQAARYGADAVGLNFYAASPRAITPAKAAAILGVLPTGVQTVGLFVKEPATQIGRILRTLQRIRVVQWYGDALDHFAADPFEWIAAFSVRGPEDLQRITRQLDEYRQQDRLPSAVLADAHVDGQYGGTGRIAPWELLAEFQPGVPLILAGGLTPENVAEAIHLVRPYAVDVASGVEQSPGRKDMEKMHRFVAAAHEAAARYQKSNETMAGPFCGPRLTV
jgi:phosphoribosylanthranilate isomerase